MLGKVMANTMYRIITRFGFLQKKLLSRSSKGHLYEMSLYNEKPQTSTSVVVSFDKNGKHCKKLSNEFKCIRRSSTRIFDLTESNCIVFSTYCNNINIPVAIERFDNTRVPVTIKVGDFLKWFAKTEDSGNKDPVQPGRIGRLDAANEAGFFHRTDRSRLKEIKKKLKDKPESTPTAPKKTG